MHDDPNPIRAMLQRSTNQRTVRVFHGDDDGSRELSRVAIEPFPRRLLARGVARKAHCDFSRAMSLTDSLS